ELKGNEYKLTAEGKPELTADELSVVSERPKAKQDAIFVPETPVKVGGTWNIKIKDLAGTFDNGFPESSVDVDKSKAEGKLLRVYEKENRKFGILQFTVQLAIRDLGDYKFKTPMTFEFRSTLDAAIDGSSTEKVLTRASRNYGNGYLEKDGREFL